MNTVSRTRFNRVQDTGTVRKSFQLVKLVRTLALGTTPYIRPRLNLLSIEVPTVKRCVFIFNARRKFSAIRRFFFRVTFDYLKEGKKKKVSKANDESIERILPNPSMIVLLGYFTKFVEKQV